MITYDFFDNFVLLTIFLKVEDINSHDNCFFLGGESAMSPATEEV